MKKYRKKRIIEAQPWTPDIDWKGVSIAEKDKPVGPGGMIAQDPKNPQDRWYISPEYFTRNYEEVT